ncbi:DNA polymerase III subunit gamma and tau [Cellulomonas bogoriensis]
MSTALYRRYRPETFTEVIGQEHVTDPLMQALRSDRVTHAYLFSGPRGCGKTTSARILARCLNCAEGPTDTPCGRCPSCRDLARGGGGSLDVVEIDAASHGGVDDARDLRERATFAPARDRFKIFILDEAHMVTSQGFNALLKIVEEPPPHIKFVFATTEPDKVIGTIRSRTHHYPFRLVSPDTLLGYLDQLCTAEGVPVGSGVLPLVVRAGGGSVRDSLSVLDQLVAGADDSGLDYERAVALLGYTHAALLDDVVEAIAARDGASAFRVVERVVVTGHEPRRFVEDLLERLRDLIVIAASGPAAQAVLRDLPADQLERMRAQAATLGPAELSRSADLTNDALTEMTGATSPRLHLELLVARLLLPAVDDGAQGLGARLDRVEREIAAGPRPTAGVPVAPPVPAAQPVRPPEASPAPPPEPRPAARPTPDPEPTADVEPAPAAGPGPERAPEPQRAPEPEPERVPEPDPAPAAEPRPTPDVPVEPAPAPPAGGTGPALDAETVRRRWPEVLQTLRGLRMATWVLVSQNGHVAEVTASTLALAFSTPQLATTFRTGPHPGNVQRALHETLGLDLRVDAVVTGAEAGAPGPGGGSRGDRGGARSEAAVTTSPRATMSVSEAEASWDVAPAPAPSATTRERTAAPPVTPAAPPAPPAYSQGAPRVPDPPPEADVAADGIPDGPEPEPDPGPEPPADSAPGGAPDRPSRDRALPATPSRASSRGPRGASRSDPAPAARAAYEDGDDTDPDDPDLVASGLVGVPLVAQLLGGVVVEEVVEDVT